MKYKKKYRRAVIEPPETRKIKQFGLDVCEICNEKLAGYRIDKGAGKTLRVCKSCCISELTDDTAPIHPCHD